MTEQHLRFVVERRFRVAPPKPYKNEWEMIYSFHEEGDAAACRIEEEQDEGTAREFRVRDTEA